jgi:hypothetical protein
MARRRARHRTEREEVDMIETEKRALQYVVNTGGTATVDDFDDDHEPIGPMLRANLMPRYMVENGEKLVLTDEGLAAVER